MTQPFDITTDSELKAAVRDETDYDSTTLPDSNADGADLDGLVQSAKRELALRADVTTFYDDRGIAVALLGLTAAKAKGAVENSPVVTEDIGGQNTTFRTPDGESLQIAQYERMVERGLAESSATDAGVQGLAVTRDFLTDSSSETY